MFRSVVPDFQLANPLYRGARVTFYTVDVNGVITATLAELYSGPTGTGRVNNPVTLDGDGKFSRPVYFDVPIIAQVESQNVPSHQTGIIQPGAGIARGPWQPNTFYQAGDVVEEVISTERRNVYTVQFSGNSAATIAADKASGKLALVFGYDLAQSYRDQAQAAAAAAALSRDAAAASAAAAAADAASVNAAAIARSVRRQAFFFSRITR